MDKEYLLEQGKKYGKEYSREEYINLHISIYNEKFPIFREFMTAYLPERFIYMQSSDIPNDANIENADEEWWSDPRDFDNDVPELYLVTNELGHYRNRILQKEGYVINLSACEDSFAECITEIFIAI